MRALVYLRQSAQEDASIAGCDLFRPWHASQNTRNDYHRDQLHYTHYFWELITWKLHLHLHHLTILELFSRCNGKISGVIHNLGYAPSITFTLFNVSELIAGNDTSTYTFYLSKNKGECNATGPHGISHHVLSRLNKHSGIMWCDGSLTTHTPLIKGVQFHSLN